MSFGALTVGTLFMMDGETYLKINVNQALRLSYPGPVEELKIVNLHHTTPVLDSKLRFMLP